MRSIQGILSRSFALTLALLSGSAAADWTAVRPGNDIYAAYADKATLRRDGGMARMSGLYDFRKQDFTPAGRGLYSTVVLREYDCREPRVRLLSAIDFSAHMGEGAVVDANRLPGRWEAVVAGGIDEAFWKIACGGS